MPTTLESELPTKTKPKQDETITGNKFDIVLACRYDIPDNIPLYDEVVRLVEQRKNHLIYSAHRDKSNDVLRYVTREAIPRTRAVLIHLSDIDLKMEAMFEATYVNGKPFLLFHHQDVDPFIPGAKFEIETQPHYVGTVTYPNQESALQLIDHRLDELLAAGGG